MDYINELSSEERELFLHWKSIENSVREDLANIWIDEIKEEFSKLETEILRVKFILDKIHKRRVNSWSMDEREIRNIKIIMEHLENRQPSEKWIAAMHNDIYKLIKDIEEEKRRINLSKLSNPFFNVYPGELSSFEINLLMHIKESLKQKSLDQKLRQISSARNRKIPDPIHSGSLIHGVKIYSSEILSSILDNGILCAEFLGIQEDAETFFHADFIESNKQSILEWQNAINSATGKLPLTVFNRLRAYMPHDSIYAQSIALIVNSSETQSWKEDYVSRDNNVKSRFIHHFPIKHTNESPNQVSILGGVASTDIYGIIISSKLNRDEVIFVLQSKGMYIPIFNALGDKIY